MIPDMGIFSALIIATVTLAASVIGAICGIGGGVIIKPALDALGLFSVSTVSFLSSCTVLAMSGYSVTRNLLGGKSSIDLQRGSWLGLGAVLGGIGGKSLFDAVRALFANPDTVGAVQAAALLLVTAATFLYTCKKEKLPTRSLQAPLACIGVGLALGLVSSFLGIGGGPFNLAVLYLLFSMSTKVAAQNSLYIILLSQLSSLLMTVFTHRIPAFSPWILAAMVALGLAGGALGRKINRRIDGKTVDRLFLGLLLVIMGICVYNVLRLA